MCPFLEFKAGNMCPITEADPKCSSMKSLKIQTHVMKQEDAADPENTKLVRMLSAMNRLNRYRRRMKL